MFFEIAISSLVGKVKLGQNREPRDRLHATEMLQARGHDDMARAMRNAGKDGCRDISHPGR